MPQQQEPRRGELIGPAELRKMISLESTAASEPLGWVALDAARYALPTSQLDAPGITHHTLVQFTRPPEKLELRYQGVKRHLPPPAGSITLIPAGSTSQWQWSGRKDSLHIYLEPELVTRSRRRSLRTRPSKA